MTSIQKEIKDFTYHSLLLSYQVDTFLHFLCFIVILKLIQLLHYALIEKEGFTI